MESQKVEFRRQRKKLNIRGAQILSNDSYLAYVEAAEDAAQQRILTFLRSRLYLFSMKPNLLIRLTAIILVLFGTSVTVSGDALIPLKPAQRDKCIVCGMFVAKYPDWISEIIFKDSRVLFFDGCKDLFKYYFNMKKYPPEKELSDISEIFVTEYYNVMFINARDAFYVVGSEVYGPMGRELIAFQSEPDAAMFLKDHRGKAIIRFTEITPELIQSLD